MKKFLLSLLVAVFCFMASMASADDSVCDEEGVLHMPRVIRVINFREDQDIKICLERGIYYIGVMDSDERSFTIDVRSQDMQITLKKGEYMIIHFMRD